MEKHAGEGEVIDANDIVYGKYEVDHITPQSLFKPCGLF